MVQATINQNTGNGCIILTPNNSSSWPFNLCVIGSLTVVSLIIAIGFLINGIWMILPFSGLELTAVATGLYICMRNNDKAEVITFDEDKVIIEKGRKIAEHTWEYQRLWSKILVRKPQHRGHPKQIFIRSHGKELELGTFLNKKDKELLVKKLKDIIYC